MGKINFSIFKLMNYSKLLALCLFATIWAFAQFPWDASSSEEASDTGSSETSPSYSEPEPSPQPSPRSGPKKPAPSKESGEKAIFDQVRGHAYNPYSTVGAATTVEDLISTPSDINGKKFFYVSPTDRLGYTAFDMLGGSAMLGLDNSALGSPAALIFGYATSGFGMALNYSVSKVWVSDGDYSDRTTSPGDNIGVYFSLPLGSGALYANANWLTYEQSTSVNYDGNESSESYSTIEANVGLADKLGALDFDAYLNVIRTGGTRVNNDGDKSVDDSTYLGLALNLDFGYAALQSSAARVIVGFNNRFVMISYDAIDVSERNAYKIMALVISPNILAEVSLFDNWLAFAGAAHALDVVIDDRDRDNDDDSRLSVMHTPGTAAFAGIRYQKTNWALEGLIATSMFNNPFGGFNGSAMFAEVGGFIYF